LNNFEDKKQKEGLGKADRVPKECFAKECVASLVIQENAQETMHMDRHEL
jgi:hypothetical protein